MADKPVDEVVQVDAALDALSSPTSSDVYEAMEPFSDGAVAAVAAKRAGGGGGSTPGAVRVLKYDFDFSQAAALATGVAVWTPAVGDWLLNARFVWTTAWVLELSPAFADIGLISGGAWVSSPNGPNGFFAGLVGAIVDLANPPWTSGSKALWSSEGTSSASLAEAAPVAASGSPYQVPSVQFLTTDPLMLVVSDDATPVGVPFDGLAGDASLYLWVATPGDTP